MIVVGLDLSLTATGIATATGTQTITSRERGMARLAELRDGILTAGAIYADLVAIEGYSFGSARSQAHALGELGGVVRLAFHEAGIDYVDVPPAVLKKFATGKGNAPKDAVLAAAVRAGFAGSSNDEADAWWLWNIGVALHGAWQVEPHIYRKEALLWNS